MPVYLICAAHRVRYARGSRCPACPPKRGKNPTEQQRARKAALVRDGGRCTFVGVDGVRCPATTGLEAAHITPYSEDGNHVVTMLCAKHHLALDRAQRNAWRI